MTANEQFLLDMRNAARSAGHVWPEYAACEVAIESGWGKSKLAREANNLFGQKAPAILQPGMRTIAMETTEILHGESETVLAHWLLFASPEDCFKARMALLNRLPAYYYDAMHAPNGEIYVREVSGAWQQTAQGNISTPSTTFQFSDGWFRWIEGRWSTDPARAFNIMLTYHAHSTIFEIPYPAMETT